MNIQAQLIHVGPNSNCVKLINGDKELSLSFRRVNDSHGSSHLQSVGLFQKGTCDQYHNNVSGIGDISQFMEWLTN